MESNNGKQPLWISLDGIDGSGKTTIASRLRNHLEENGYPTLIIPVLNQGPISKAFRERLIHGKPIDLKLEAAGLLAAFSESFEDYIKPALLSGCSVISDRWLASMMGYQVYKNKKIHPIYALLNTYLEDYDFQNPQILRRPDLEFYLKIDAETSQRRTLGRFQSFNNDPEDLNAFDMTGIKEKNRIINGMEFYISNIVRDSQVTVDASEPLEDVLNFMLNVIDIEITEQKTTNHFNDLLAESKSCLSSFRLKQRDRFTSSMSMGL